MKYSYFRLDELGIVSRGRSKHRPRNDSSLYGGEYPFIQTADVKNAGLYITEWNQTYNEKGLAQSKLWKPGTLCITIAANIADTAILCMPACFPDSIIGFIPFEDKCDVKYMKYCFDILQMECQQIAEGTAQDNLSWEKLSTIRFPMPDIAIQNRIASILSAYDDLIENNRRQIKLLEEAAQRLYREWFVELRFPGYENVEIVDGVPEGWRKKPFSQIVTIMSGGTPKTDNKAYYNGSIPFYTPKDSDGAFFSYSTQTYITEEGLSNCHSPLYPEGTIVITARGTVGKTTILGVPMAMNQSCYALKCEQYSMPYYLFFSLNEEVRKLKAMANGGVFNTIIVKTFDNICMFEPELSVVSHFNEMVSTYMESIKLKMKQQQKLIEARDRLLPKLMSGEMEV